MAPSTPITSEDPVGSGAGGSLLSSSPEALRDLRRQFGEQHYIKLPAFFDRRLFDTTRRQLADAEFEVVTWGLGIERTMKPNALVATLNWLMNAPELVRAIRYVTDCEEVGYFEGRVYGMDPSTGQSFAWHDDLGPETARRVAMSLNVGDRPYAGGVLQIREKSAPDVVTEVPNPGPGDAVLFRLAPDLEHRVTPVEGTVSKLAFAGWFHQGPSYHRALLQAGRSARPG